MNSLDLAVGTYTVSEFIDAYSFGSPGNIGLLIVSGITFFFGYMEYIYSFRLVLREKSAPYPLPMHTFYFAHDTTGAVIFLTLASQTNWFWFFTGAGIALIIWNFFEMFNLYKAVTVERAAIWGPGVGIKRALFDCVLQIMLFYGIVNLLRIFMLDSCMFKWFLFTNVVMAVVPGLFWEKRGTRTGASMGLAIIILIATINTFLPGNMWMRASAYFDQPWYYLLGAICVFFAARGVWVLWKLPKKERIAGMKPPIW